MVDPSVPGGSSNAGKVPVITGDKTPEEAVS